MFDAAVVFYAATSKRCVPSRRPTRHHPLHWPSFSSPGPRLQPQSQQSHPSAPYSHPPGSVNHRVRLLRVFPVSRSSQVSERPCRSRFCHRVKKGDKKWTKKERRKRDRETIWLRAQPGVVFGYVANFWLPPRALVAWSFRRVCSGDKARAEFVRFFSAWRFSLYESVQLRYGSLKIRGNVSSSQLLKILCFFRVFFKIAKHSGKCFYYCQLRLKFFIFVKFFLWIMERSEKAF